MKTADRIHKRAYEIWEREGRPDGQHDAHWEQARRECEAEDAAVPPAATPPEAPAPKAAKPAKEPVPEVEAPAAKAPKPAKAAAKPATRRGKKGSAAD